MVGLFDVAINIYNYGSYVYGTYKEGISDKDFIIIVPDNCNCEGQIKYKGADYNIYKESDWIKKLENNDIECLECEFLNNEFIVKKTKDYEFKLDKDLVRKNISSVASNSYVKCKKKLIVKDSYNPRIAKKSLWHSLRLLDFGKQIMSANKIYDYSSANNLYNDIMSAPDDWEYLKTVYKPIYNKYKSEFKIQHNSIDIER